MPARRLSSLGESLRLGTNAPEPPSERQHRARQHGRNAGAQESALCPVLCVRACTPAGVHAAARLRGRAPERARLATRTERARHPPPEGGTDERGRAAARAGRRATPHAQAAGVLHGPRLTRCAGRRHCGLAEKRWRRWKRGSGDRAAAVPRQPWPSRPAQQQGGKMLQVWPSDDI